MARLNSGAVGSEMKKGGPLWMISVTKLFTTIRSEVTGRVVTIGPEHNELVG
jgi:hypothetical protein